MWRVTYKRVFLQELKRLPHDMRSQVEEFVFVTLPMAENPFTSTQIKKLTGYQDYYRVRFGDYRVGLRIDRQAQFSECCRQAQKRHLSPVSLSLE